MTIDDVLGIREGDTLELRRGSDVLTGTYERFELTGDTYGPDLITEWLDVAHGGIGRVPVAWVVSKLIATGWVLRVVDRPVAS